MWFLSMPVFAAPNDISVVVPSQDSTVTAGETLHVEVSAGPGIATVLLWVNEPGGLGMSGERPGPKAIFDVPIPPTAIGRQNVVASGFDANGRIVAVSEGVRVQALVPSRLTSITVYPAKIHILPCQTVSLEITGHYADGLDRKLSYQPELTMAFGKGNAVQTLPNVLMMNKYGNDTVIVGYGAVGSDPVVIEPLGPDPGPCR